MAAKQGAIGHIVQVIGPVVDVKFDSDKALPEIFNALRITSEGFDIADPIDIICEVQQHLGENRVRAVALQPTEGLVRGMKAYDQGEGVTVPVGRETLGPRDERARPASGQYRSDQRDDTLSNSPPGANARRSVHHAGNVRDGN